MLKQPNSSWEKVSGWYDKTVGEKGHYYHQHVILPNLLRLIGKTNEAKILDLGCGQAVLSRHLPQEAIYCGVDISAGLIQAATQRKTQKNISFFERDLSLPLDLPKKDFTHAVFLLSLQNMPNASIAIKSAAAHLKKEGKLILILNHPCFRVPRQSSWETDPHKKLQYRRIDRYLTPLEVPIKTHPGKDKSEDTLSFHYPLSTYSQWLKEAHFTIESIEEWTSDKESIGKAAKMENFSRQEIPLFLTLVARFS